MVQISYEIVQKWSTVLLRICGGMAVGSDRADSTWNNSPADHCQHCPHEMCLCNIGI
jgi:hypothetical protein